MIRYGITMHAPLTLVIVSCVMPLSRPAPVGNRMPSTTSGKRYFEPNRVSISTSRNMELDEKGVDGGVAEDPGRVLRAENVQRLARHGAEQRVDVGSGHRPGDELDLLPQLGRPRVREMGPGGSGESVSCHCTHTRLRTIPFVFSIDLRNSSSCLAFSTSTVPSGSLVPAAARAMRASYCC